MNGLSVVQQPGQKTPNGLSDQIMWKVDASACIVTIITAKTSCSVQPAPRCGSLHYAMSPCMRNNGLMREKPTQQTLYSLRACRVMHFWVLLVLGVAEITITAATLASYALIKPPQGSLPLVGMLCPDVCPTCRRWFVQVRD
jgi:hypothetical protein